MLLKNDVVSFVAPRPNVVAYEMEYYTRLTGCEKMRLRVLEISDDILDDGLRSWSSDNGATWPSSVAYEIGKPSPGGMLRIMEFGGFVDPVNGRLLHVLLEGILPDDHALDGMKCFSLVYRVSEDGGRSILHQDRIVVEGKAYSPCHPNPYVHVGKNAWLMGAESAILRNRQGQLIVATNFTPLDENGGLANPGGGYIWAEVLMLLGEWQNDGSIVWHSGPHLTIDPKLSTRGLLEPTLAQLPDGRILMVMRGSNGGSKDRSCELPAYKWYCVSEDGGHTWSEVAPWTYTDGEAFYSPSSIGQLFTHSSGKQFWVGNISPENSRANGPRYPLVIGEVDTQSLLLKRETVFNIAGHEESDGPMPDYSNFHVHEDRISGELIVHVTPFYSKRGENAWGDAHIYRLEI